jgi:6-phosphofructokinase 1
VRSIELNLPQRCAAHLLSATDIKESLRTGEAAVQAAAEGATGEMMTIDRISDAPYATEIGHKPVAEIANRVRYVDADFINEAGNDVTDACCRYLQPLIEGEIALPFEGGVPRFYRFS